VESLVSSERSSDGDDRRPDRTRVPDVRRRGIAGAGTACLLHVWGVQVKSWKPCYVCVRRSTSTPATGAARVRGAPRTGRAPGRA